MGHELKKPEHTPKPILPEHYGCSVQNVARKNPKYSRNDTILKIAYLAKAVAQKKLYRLQNGQFGSKVVNLKNMPKSILPDHYSCSVQTTVQEKKKHQILGEIRKIGRLAILQR